MAETNELAGRIEKLIVDGQQDLVRQVREIVYEVRKDLSLEMREMRTELMAEIRAGDSRLENIITTNTNALYGLLQDTREDVKKIGERIDEHVRQPHLA